MTTKFQLVNALFETAKREPQRIAIYHREGNLTYGELAQYIQMAGSCIQQINRLGPIAIHLSRSPALIAALFSSWFADRPFVALDPKQPTERKKKILQDAEPALVITDLPLGVENEIEWHKLLQSIEEISPLLSQSRLAYLLYTSGSTGQPKGICITDHNVVSLVNWAHQHFRLEELSCVLASTTITFDLSIFEIFVPLTCGQAIFLVQSIVDLIEKAEQFPKISCINTVPSAMRELLRHCAIPPYVQVINLAGESLGWTLVEEIYQTTQVEKVYNLYGPSEDTTYSTVYHCPRFFSSRNLKEVCVPIGKAILGSTAFVLDEQLRPLPRGSVGEICLAGSGVAEGYLNNPSLTQQKFIFIEDQRVYRTGDLGYVDSEGELHFKGRVDNQVKVRGYRIELEEVEQHLLKIQGVCQAIATIIEENGQSKLVAGLQLTCNTDEMFQQIKNALSSQLPHYMIPQKWRISTAPLETTSSGKLCRNALARQFTTLENAIENNENFEGIVEQVLNGKINLKKSFIDNGGDSLAALRLLALCRKKWNTSASIATILDHNCTLDSLKTRITLEEKCHSESEDHLALPSNGIHASEYRMWKVIQAHPRPEAYHVFCELTITGSLSFDRLVIACERVIGELPSFQSNYYFKEGELKKVRTTSQLEIITYSNFDEEAFYYDPFDLKTDFLMRVACIQEERQTRLLFCAPHIVIDGLGLDALLRAIGEEYAGRSRKKNLEVLEHQGDKKRAVDYWKELLKDPIQSLSWPIANQREKSFCCITEIFSADKVADLKQLATHLHVTFPFFMLAAVKLALYRINLGDDLILGFPVGNRSQQAMQECISNLTNTMLIRLKINGQLSVQEFILQVYRKALASLEHQEISIDVALIEALEGKQGSENLFDILFSYMDFADGALLLEGCHVERRFPIPKYAKAPLVFSVIPNRSGTMEIRLEYQGSQLSYSFAKSLLSLLGELLEEMSQNLSLKLEDLPTISKQQIPVIKQVMVPRLTHPIEENLVSWFQKVAEKFKDNVAVEDHELTMTYRELWASACKIAHALLERGVKPGDPIGISMPQSKELISGILGVLTAGCHYIPLDPSNSLLRNQYIVVHSKIRFCISSCTETRVDLDCEQISIQELLLEKKSEIPSLSYHPFSLAYIIYTSGTTGKPKGVAISHANVSTLFHSCHRWTQFCDKDRWTLFHSYAFDFSVWELFGALLYGGTLVIVSSKERADPKQVAQLIEERSITIFNQTPTAFKNLLASEVRLKHLPRMIIFGGEALYPDLLNAWWDLYGIEKTQIINMYGITEVTIHATWQEMIPGSKGSNIGKPLDHMGIVIVDQRGNPCPIGIVGEIWVSGSGLCQGYVNHAELNQKFIEKSFFGESHQRYYLSGDQARLNEDGTIEYIGRLDKQVKINGYRIEIVEVIGALKKVEGIAEAHVCKRVIDGDNAMLIAYYTGEEGIKESQIRMQMQSFLPDYCIPSCFVYLDRFPMTVNGKIDEEKLPPPQLKKELISLSFEEMVRAIWSEVLNTNQQKTHQTFFEAGGNSMKALLLIEKIHAQMNKKHKIVSIVDLFRYPTLTEFMQVLNSRLTKELI